MYRRWIAVPGIQAADIAVLSALYAHADRDGVCTATQGELAEELGQSRAWFNAVLKGLQEPSAALVCAQPRRGLRGFAYRLTGMEGVTAGMSCQPADSGGSPAGFSYDSQNPESSSSQPGGETVRQDGALPADWQPSAADLAWAAQERPEVDAGRVTAKFVAWCRKAHVRNGYRPPDPGAAWRRWILRELVAPPDAAHDPAGMAPSVEPSAFIPSAVRNHRREPRHDRRSVLPRSGSAPDASSNAGVRNRETLAALRLRLAGQS
ncbi:MarR family transcriptional regulator (plasmid) [Azospirillum humicireducens]|uniref:MarR family transcriptional regulator n=1 Tax=Azospirillum humicireducens TaxID=1226968 RepID=A0A2R4VTK6_9PROT|nr:MarR family transcriptional regulator [Azospirillum humicireducens]